MTIFIITVESYNPVFSFTGGKFVFVHGNIFLRSHHDSQFNTVQVTDQK